MIAVVFHRLGPYHRARLSAAARRQPILSIELSGETTEYAWDRVVDDHSFIRVTLFPNQDSRLTCPKHLRARLNAVLDQYRPEAVAIPGWSDGGALISLHWALRNEVPAILMSETNAHDEPRRLWKEQVKRAVVGLCHAGLVGGKGHADYLAALGMPPDRIFCGYDVVENDFFCTHSDIARADATAKRREMGLPERYFLASNRFIPKKNLPFLLHAFAKYRALAHDDAWSLVLLGDGAQKPDLINIVLECGLREFVFFPGFKQYADLPAYYGLAQAFVHASTTEQWGLVVNEAMASGLPVLVSDRCGCAPDLVRDGANGYVFDPMDVDQLAARMLQLTQSTPLQIAAMSNNSRGIISAYSPERFAAGLESAVARARVIGPIWAKCLQMGFLKLLLHR